MPDFIVDVLKHLAGAGALAAFAWFLGPLKWVIQNHRLKRFLVPERQFRFVFNAPAQKAKVVTFLRSGEIGEGRNANECSWRVRRGKLEILAADGKVYSRFAHHQETGQLRHTNDTDTRSLPNQYFEPSLVRVDVGAVQQSGEVDVPRSETSARR